MNPSTAALSIGFSALLASSGEPLTLLRSSGNVADVACLVDRTPERLARNNVPDFDADRASVIELFQSAVTPAPAVGESWQDANDVFHRITRVKVIDDFKIRCTCEASDE
jgi:hypothetical protein